MVAELLPSLNFQPFRSIVFPETFLSSTNSCSGRPTGGDGSAMISSITTSFRSIAWELTYRVNEQNANKKNPFINGTSIKMVHDECRAFAFHNATCAAKRFQDFFNRKFGFNN